MRIAITTGAIVAALALAPAASAELRAGDIIVADPNAFGGRGGLIDVDPATGAQSVVSNDQISAQQLFSDPTGVALLPDGDLVVADPSAFGGSGGLIRVDPASGQQTPLASNATSLLQLFVDPVGVEVRSDGTILVADQNAIGGSGAVISVDPATGQQSLVSDNAMSAKKLLSDPSGIVVERSGTIVVSDPNSPAGSGNRGALIAVDPNTGAQSLVTSNDSSQTDLFSDPNGVTIETPGTLLVANAAPDPSADGVVLVNRSSGQQYALATDGPFVTPAAIAMNLDGKAVVADRNSFGGGGGLIVVDPTTGAEGVLSGDPTAPGAQFVDPSGLMVVPPTCLGRYATIVGSDAADALTGTPGPDVISGRGGNDIIDGEQGNDLICGDDGNDRLIGQDGNDSFLGGNGRDVILGGNGRDSIKGESGDDEADGGPGNDRIFGQQKGDNLVGGKGNDTLLGGPGRDKLRGGPGHDRLRGGPGRDIQKQ